MGASWPFDVAIYMNQDETDPSISISSDSFVSEKARSVMLRRSEGTHQSSSIGGQPVLSANDTTSKEHLDLNVLSTISPII